MPEPRLCTEPWQDIYGHAKDLGEVWALKKGPRVVRCVLQGHPIGSEARILVDDALVSTQAFRDTKTMVDTTTSWREAFESKGWSSR